MSFSQPAESEAVEESDGFGRRDRQDDRGDATGGAIKGRSLLSIAWRRLRQDKVAMAGGVVVVLFILIGVFAGVITKLYGTSYGAPEDPTSLLDPNTNLPLGAAGGISGSHWLGVTPSTAQDIFALLVFGARTSLFIAGLATLFSLVLGITLGLIAGYYRGWADTLISRIMDVILSFPVLLFSLALIAVVGIIVPAGDPAVVARNAIIIGVLGFFGFPYIGRIVRGQVLSLREKEFVEAARSLGASDARIMFREILPNLLGPILVYTTLTIPNYILGEAGLSFLGIGIIPPTPSWGQMLSDAAQYVQVDPLYLVWPGLAIFITVLAFNLFGDGLHDAFDPKSTR
ncbi:ABC transporter permease [Amnibacterium endophyticum]|uniref:ABC transporter permease n=1 Tax=Amnibacterium endophyticum TaxID=2109337 RepID=A0ABW4LA91_9MICO